MYVCAHRFGLVVECNVLAVSWVGGLSLTSNHGYLGRFLFKCFVSSCQLSFYQCPILICYQQLVQ
jgi:hypothetical protein